MTQSTGYSKINFEKLIKEYKVTAIEPFTQYLKEIWKDLSERSEEKGKGLNRLTFSKVFISILLIIIIVL